MARAKATYYAAALIDAEKAAGNKLYTQITYIYDQHFFVLQQQNYYSYIGFFGRKLSFLYETIKRNIIYYYIIFV